MIKLFSLARQITGLSKNQRIEKSFKCYMKAFGWARNENFSTLCRGKLQLKLN